MEAEDTFASRLGRSFTHSNLTLSLMREKPSARGIAYSPSTPSLWRSGRTTPKRLNSLSAVRALEDILKVRRGYLESMVEAHTPCGPGWGNTVDVLEKLTVHGRDVAEVVDELGVGARDIIHRQFVVDTIRLDARRTMREVHSVEILQARTDGAQHHLIITSGDELLDDGRINMRTLHMNLGGSVVDHRLLPDIGCAVHKIEFERSLETGESFLLDDVVQPAEPHGIRAEPLTSYDLHFARPFGEVVVSAEFEPDDVPQRAWARYESLTTEDLGAPTEDDRLRIVERSATFAAQAVAPGIIEMRWEWDTPPRR